MRLITFVLLLVLPSFGSVSGSASADTITTSQSASWSSEVNVPKGTHWSALSKMKAKRLISLLESDLTKMLSFYKAQGATSVSSHRSKAVSAYLRKYGLRYQEVTYIGKTSSGKSLGKKYTFPKTQVSFANNLVRLNSDHCYLSAFSLWVPDTWFKTECAVEKPRVEDFLRAQMATKFSLGPGNAQDVVNYELLKLKYVLEHKIPFQIQGDKLIFKEVAAFGTENRIWLGAVTGWFDFKITVEPAKWAATISYYAPDAAKLSKHCGLDVSMRMLTF